METLEELARRVAASHAFDTHVVEKQEFAKEEYGPPIPVTTREDFAQHIAKVLESTETLCCTVYSTRFQKAQADLFYHPHTNTLIILPLNQASEPTAYRPEEGVALLYLKIEQARRAEQRALPVVNSIYELRPELAAAKEAQRIKEADAALRAAVEQRFSKEKQDMQERHRRELQRSSSPRDDQKRNAEELRALEKRKEQDFDRYRRERESAHALRERDKAERVRQRQIDGPELGGGRTR